MRLSSRGVSASAIGAPLTLFAARNVLVSGAVVFGCYGVYASLVLSPVVKWLDENEKELTAHERKEMIEVEPLFIALPFTIRAKEPPPYTSNDPEWKEFVKISRDRKLQRKLRGKRAQPSIPSSAVY